MRIHTIFPFWLSALAAVPGPLAAKEFVAFGTGDAVSMSPAGATWEQAWGSAAWPWWAGPPTTPSFLGPNVKGLLVTQTTGLPAVDLPSFRAQAPFAGTLTLTAYSLADPSREIGKIAGETRGIFHIDFNPARMIEDPARGLLGAPFGTAAVGLSDPDAEITITDANGIYSSLAPVSPWTWHVKGVVYFPKVEGLDPVQNALAALGGKIPIAGAEEEIVLAGAYDGDVGWASCSYGWGDSTELSPTAGVIWTQRWGADPFAWCPGLPGSRPLLGANVSADLRTQITGAPRVDMTALIVAIPFAGTIEFTAHEGDVTGPAIGILAGTIHGIFHLDLNPAHMREEGGELLVPFGSGMLGLPAPEAAIAFTKATGIYEALEPAGVFSWSVAGWIHCLRVPELAPIQNIFAALQGKVPVTQAHEEICLCGRFAGGARPADLRPVAYKWGSPAWRWAPYPLFKGWLHAKLANAGTGAARNVAARVETCPAGTTPVDPTVAFGAIAPGSTAWSADTFSLITDVGKAADPRAGITWTIEYDDELGFHHVVEGVPQLAAQ